MRPSAHAAAARTRDAPSFSPIASADSPDASPSSPLAWHRDFAETRHRLRDWVAACGTRLDRDRPTRQIAWPGEPASLPTSEASVTDRDADFVQFVMEDVTARRQVEAELERHAS